MDLKDFIYKSIQDTQNEKIMLNKEPNHVLSSEINNTVITEIKKQLNELVKEKKITFGKTLNENYFKIT